MKNDMDYKKLAQELKSQIERHNYLYYILDKPEISDAEFDELFGRLIKIETDYPELRTSDSPTQRVGAPPVLKFPTCKHIIPMLSLGKCTTPEEFREFDRRVKDLLEGVGESIEYSVEPKYDGLAVTLIYKNGFLELGATRGDGFSGEVVTENLRTVRTIPLKLRMDKPIKTLEVRGEVIIYKADFDRFNKQRSVAGMELFANPRNMAAGSLRQLDSHITAERPLRFIAYGIGVIDGYSPGGHFETMKYLQAVGFEVSDYLEKYNVISKIEHFYKDILAKRDSLPYDIDGIVIKIDSYRQQAAAGVLSRSPRWAAAWKFPAIQRTTIVEDIKVQVGRTGILTPVAYLTPVQVGGVTVARATLHNDQEIERKDIRVGDTVIVQRAGDVIPEIVMVVSEKRTGRERKFSMPSKCPACGSPVQRVEGEVAVKCSSLYCPAQIVEKITHFGSRSAMDIEGLGYRTVELLVEKGFIKDISDLYLLPLKKDEILKIERMGEKSFSNLVAALERSRKRELPRIIFALGISGVGETTAYFLAESFGSIEHLINVGEEIISEIKGIGPVIAHSVYMFFHDEKNVNVIRKLGKYGVEFPELLKNIHDGPLKDKTFVLTGTLENYSRSEAEKEIEILGGKVTTAVSQNTNYLLAGANPGSKLDKAKKLGITIIDEVEFKRLLAKLNER